VFGLQVNDLDPFLDVCKEMKYEYGAASSFFFGVQFDVENAYHSLTIFYVTLFCTNQIHCSHFVIVYRNLRHQL